MGAPRARKPQSEALPEIPGEGAEALDAGAVREDARGPEGGSSGVGEAEPSKSRAQQVIDAHTVSLVGGRYLAQIDGVTQAIAEHRKGELVLTDHGEVLAKEMFGAGT